MAWNPKYAAHRWFRKRGDTVEGGAKLVIYNSPAPDSAAHTKHRETLRGLKYGFANSLFQKAYEAVLEQ